MAGAFIMKPPIYSPNPLIPSFSFSCSDLLFSQHFSPSPVHYDPSISNCIPLQFRCGEGIRVFRNRNSATPQPSTNHPWSFTQNKPDATHTQTHTHSPTEMQHTQTLTPTYPDTYMHTQYKKKYISKKKYDSAKLKKMKEGKRLTSNLHVT